MSSRCFACGANTREQERFCSQCGSPVLANPTEPAELKLLTVVAYSVPGHAAMCTEFAEALVAHPEIRDVAHTLDQLYQRAGGLVLGPQMGDPDTRYCVFGTSALNPSMGPDALENENPSLTAANAIRTSAAVLSTVKVLSADSWRATGCPLEVHIGIDSGKALVQRSSTDGQVDAVDGVPLVVASRLAAAAAAQTIVVDESTRQAAGDTFVFREAPAARFFGLGTHVPCFELQIQTRRRQNSRRRLFTGRGHHAVVGRDLEMRRVRDAVEAATSRGTVATIVVEGAPTMGASKFVQEAIEGARTQNGRLTLADARIPSRQRQRERPRPAGTPFHLLAQWVQRVCGLDPGTHPEQGRTHLQAFIASVTTGMPLSPLDEQWLQHLAGLAPPPAVVGDDAALAAEFSFRATAELFRLVAKTRVLLVVVECLSDATARELAIVRRMVSELGELGATFLVTGGPDLHRGLSEAHGRAVGAEANRDSDGSTSSPGDIQDASKQLTVITLQALSHDAGRVFVDQILGRRDAVPRAHAALIVDHCAGAPGLIAQTLALLSESEALVLDDVTGKWRLNDDNLPTDLPTEIRETSARRLDFLPPAHVHTLARAAACGDVFWTNLLENLGDPEAGAHVIALEESGVVVTNSNGALEGHLGYRIDNHFMAEAAYGRLAPDESRHLHDRVARWLAANTGERFNAWMGAIALQFEAAGDTDRAVSYHMQAGEWGRRRGDLSHATEQFDRAQQTATNPELKAEAALELGLCWILQGHHDKAIPLVQDTLAAARKGGDEHNSLRALLPLVIAAGRQGQFKRTRALIADGLRLAERLGDVRVGGRLNLEAARLEVFDLRENEANRSAEASLEALSQCGDRLGILTANVETSRALLHTGQVTRAGMAYEEAKRFAAELNHWLLLMRAQHGTAWVDWLSGRGAGAEASFTHCAQQFERIGDVDQAVGAAVGRSLCLIDRGRFAEAANSAAFAQALAQARNRPAAAALATSAVGHVLGCVERVGHRLKAKLLTPTALAAARTNRQTHLTSAVAALEETACPRLYRVLVHLFAAEYLLAKDPTHGAGRRSAAQALDLVRDYEGCTFLTRVQAIGA